LGAYPPFGRDSFSHDRQREHATAVLSEEENKETVTQRKKRTKRKGKGSRLFDKKKIEIVVTSKAAQRVHLFSSIFWCLSLSSFRWHPIRSGRSPACNRSFVNFKLTVLIKQTTIKEKAKNQ
jgi:hypothetical protein